MSVLHNFDNLYTELIVCSFIFMFLCGLFVPYSYIEASFISGIRFLNPCWWLLQCGLSVIHHDLPEDYEYGCVKKDSCIYDNYPDFAHELMLDEFTTCYEFTLIHLMLVFLLMVLTYYSYR
eukprot:UN05471